MQQAQLRPGDAERLRETAAAAATGELDRAIALAKSALAGGLSHPLFLKLRAVDHERGGRVGEAIADLRAALADAPGDLAALNALGLCLTRAGRPREALVELARALALKPDFLQAQLNRAAALESLGELVEARAAYERALELEPSNSRAPAALAWLAARRADWSEARARGAAALAVGSEPVARLALSLADLREGHPAEAEAGVRTLLGEGALPPHERSSAHWLLAECLDALDRPDDAFAAYGEANAILRGFYLPSGAAPGESTLAFAQRLGARFAASAPKSWPRGPAQAGPRPSDGGGHAFVVGFPRSGTTLLGQVLAAHPKVVTIDEQEFLAAPAGPYLQQPGGLDRLERAEAAELAPHRQAYWERVRRIAGDLDGRMLVDKLPMNTLALPLIARLFPDSRAVFMVRDPRDVVLSCFKQPFVPNRTNLEFLELESAALLYDAVMCLADDLRTALDLPILQLRLEDLVADFEGETRRLCAFLDLEWTSSLADFSGAARAGRIATPSAGRLAGGLSGEGVGRWRPYREAMAPVMPILQPWVDRFGYDAA